MIIGINVAAAIKQPRTGVEEYTYQLIKHLTMLPESGEHRFLLYLPAEVRRTKAGEPKDSPHLFEPEGSSEPDRPNPLLREERENTFFDFPLPPNFEIKVLCWPLPFLWTQIRLAWEILRRSPDVLFIPVHILPFFSPKNSVVTIHGLEYEYFQEYYPFWHRVYLKWSTKRAVKKAGKIIAISENTKNDLIKFYGARAEKIEVVHHGVFVCHSEAVGRGISHECGTGIRQRSLAALGMTTREKPYILYLGRLETKKNVQGILEAYKILKEEYQIPHKLVLAGVPGYGYENLKFKIENLKLQITELGYVDEDEKWRLLSEADIFLFPSFYEGFGLPVLEAQAAGVSVVTSASSCLPEIAGQGALFVNPKNPARIAEAVKQIIDDNDLRDRLRQSGFENIKQFSWEKCAKETLGVIIKI